MRPIVNMPEEDRATDIGSIHKELVNIARVVPETSSRTDTHTETNRLITILRNRCNKSELKKLKRTKLFSKQNNASSFEGLKQLARNLSAESARVTAFGDVGSFCIPRRVTSRLLVVLSRKCLQWWRREWPSRSRPGRLRCQAATPSSE